VSPFRAGKTVYMATSKSPKLLEDFLDLEPFAAEVGRCVRTIKRWTQEPDGLPYTRLGNRVLIHVPTAREWLFKRMQPRAPRRKPRREAA
jgi:hypothetical protein